MEALLALQPGLFFWPPAKSSFANIALVVRAGCAARLRDCLLWGPVMGEGNPVTWRAPLATTYLLNQIAMNCS